MAEVFLASTVGAEGFSRKVAIKRVLPGFSQNPAFSSMFIDEARISSRLSHPNIVSVLDFDRDPEGRLYLVMELVNGKDLDALCSTGPLPYPVIIYTISEMLRGLGHAHDLPASPDDIAMTGETIRAMKGLVHRDVSPHNVLLSWEGAVKVSDFGIAKARTAAEATASVFIKGKPAYMSPEQANGQALDGRSDLFAVGVMLWEMLCSRRLFTGEDTRATLAAVLFGQIPRPRQLRPDVPKDLERVTMKLLERDLPARYATAEDAIHDLLECDDAPKTGREVLIKVLAERFPAEAPVRNSILRQRGTPQAQSAQGYPQSTQAGYGTPIPGQEIPNHDRATIGSNPGTPMPMHSMGAMRSTPTNTMQPGSSIHQHVGPAATIPPMRSASSSTGKRIALGVGGLVAGGLITFGIVSAMKKSPSSPAAGSVKQDAVAQDDQTTPPPPVPPDAAPADSAIAVVPAPPVDAGVPEPDAKVEIPTESAHARDRKKQGRLVVRAFPVMTVYVDGKKVRDTPVDMKLPVGKHKLRLVNAEVGKDEALVVTIDENKSTTIER
ncbi:MAG: serine/threonine protein kinase [Kofleriaceae bacterium]|nr:serine/threonine protein kinase [Kofleriaceae bacterium]